MAILIHSMIMEYSIELIMEAGKNHGTFVSARDQHHERKHVSGSPFALLVDPDATQPLLCFAEGAGLHGAEAGTPA